MFPPLPHSFWVGALRSMVASVCTSIFVYVRETHSPPYFVYDGLEPRLVVLSIRDVFCIHILGLYVVPSSG